jgi:hypothetical protein
MDIPRTTSSDPLDSQASSKGLWPAKLLRGLLLAFMLDAFVRPAKPSQSFRTRAISIAGSVLLFVIAGSWLRLVDTYVPEPYLVTAPPFKIIELSPADESARMKSSIFLRRRPTAQDASGTGMTRSPLRQACQTTHSPSSCLLAGY